MQVQLNRPSISPLTRLHPTAGKIPARLASGFAFSQPAISPRRGIITFLSHDSRMMGSGAKAQAMRSELVLGVADDLACLDAQRDSEM